MYSVYLMFASSFAMVVELLLCKVLDFNSLVFSAVDNAIGKCSVVCPYNILSRAGPFSWRKHQVKFGTAHIKIAIDCLTLNKQSHTGSVGATSIVGRGAQYVQQILVRLSITFSIAHRRTWSMICNPTSITNIHLGPVDTQWLGTLDHTSKLATILATELIVKFLPHYSGTCINSDCQL